MIRRIVKRLLNLIPSRAIVIVLSGPLKGLKWVKGSGVNGYWLGTYEKQEVKRFVSMISANDVVFDVGAQAGYYSLIAARRGAEVYAFEPLDENLRILNRNIELNGMRVKVYPYAVSDKSGTVLFGKIDESNLFTARIGQGKKTMCVTLDEIIEKKALKPTVIKIDVEGYEDNVLRGAEKFIRKYHPRLMVATTGTTSVDLVKSLGYAKIDVVDNNSIFAE